jgi:molybdopterin synthase sulfur carrier subunit
MADSITIDLCGRLADPLGPNVTLHLGTPATVATILTRLAVTYPALNEVMRATRIHMAIDEQLTGEDAIIAPGQRLALFPPVSGG